MTGPRSVPEPARLWWTLGLEPAYRGVWVRAWVLTVLPAAVAAITIDAMSTVLPLWLRWRPFPWGVNLMYWTAGYVTSRQLRRFWAWVWGQYHSILEATEAAHDH